MPFQKQTKFKNGKKDPNEEKIKFKDDSTYARKFLSDWEECRDRHPGQKEVLKATFEDKMQYVFYRAGRKGAKTTTLLKESRLFGRKEGFKHVIKKTILCSTNTSKKSMTLAI